MKTNIAKWTVTSLGFGYAPFAPGTFGAIAGTLSYIGLYQIFPTSIDYLLLALIVVFTIAGTWGCSVLESEWGHDPSRCVLDETVGIYITYLFMPFSWPTIIVGLILFRFFDILKPLGVKTIDTKLHSPFSVMLDDILAGVYALIVLQILIHYNVLA